MAMLNMQKFMDQARQADLDAEKRRASFKSEVEIGGIVYPLWSPSETTRDNQNVNVIRFGPPYGDHDMICVHLQEHSFKVGDEFVKFTCPKTLGLDEDCPCCTEQYKMFRASRESGDNGDRARSNEMRARYKAVFAILDKTHLIKQDGGSKAPNWQVFKVGAGPSGAGMQTTFAKIVGKFDRYADLSHPQTGRWIRLVYTLGNDPATGKPSRRFGNYDFEPLDPASALPKGWEVNQPDLRLLLAPESVPTADQVLELIGMGGSFGAEAAQGEPWESPGAEVAAVEAGFGEDGGGPAGFGSGGDSGEGEGSPFSFGGEEEPKPEKPAAKPSAGGFASVSTPRGAAKSASVKSGRGAATSVRKGR